MQLDQRAWVGVSDEAIIPATDEKGSFFKLGLTIKNTGKTPALKVSAESITAPAVRGDNPPTWEEIENNLHASYQPSGTSEILKEYVGPGVGYQAAVRRKQMFLEGVPVNSRRSELWARGPTKSQSTLSRICSICSRCHTLALFFISNSDA